MSKPKRNVVIWAHSDQAGGTEIACVLADALKKKDRVHAAIATPRGKDVQRYFAGTVPDDLEVIETPPYLRLANDTGRVNAENTYKTVLAAPFYQDLDAEVKQQVELMRPRVEEGALFISVGEPMAHAVAKRLEPRSPSVIVTDHLLTATIRWVLSHGGRYDSRIADFMTRLESFDRLADEAFLSPIEFAARDYERYLSYGGVRCVPIGGLFYDPPASRSLNRNASPHKILVDFVGETGKVPLVVVFGGGGDVWLRLQSGLNQKLTEENPRDFAVIVPAVAGKDVLMEEKHHRFNLYLPGRKPEQLDDPGKLMEWYAAADLVVGRGGLVAQQVLATMLGDTPRAPHMLFIEQPGHPQIEHERLSLYNLGFVHTRTLADFERDPLGHIAATIGSIREEDHHPRHAVRVRYGLNMMSALAEYLVNRYVS